MVFHTGGEKWVIAPKIHPPITQWVASPKSPITQWVMGGLWVMAPFRPLISYDRSEIYTKIHQNFCIFLFSIVENVKITKIQQNWKFKNSCPDIIVTKFNSIKKRVL
jgi:hypothetical protein